MINCNSWVYKHIFVADGNFKADHVRHKNPAEDVLLSEGSGMMPKSQEYLTFLASAIERLTVSYDPMPVPVNQTHAGAGAGWLIYHHDHFIHYRL
jgi:hypothetical protein